MTKLKRILIFCVTVCCYSAMYAQPTVTSMNPRSGPAGTVVTITGTNFNPATDQNTVYFGAAKATVTSATSTTLKVIAPGGATYTPVTVSTSGLTAYGPP